MLGLHLIGTGNLAYHWSRLLCRSTLVDRMVVWYRHGGDAPEYMDAVELPEDTRELPPADLTILCVPDSRLQFVSDRLPPQCGLVVHCSGATPLDILKRHERRGVFYPLQTLRSGHDLEPWHIPVLVEAGNNSDLELLLQLGRSVFPQVQSLSSDSRLRLHLAAVVANNFTNYLYHWSRDICQKEELEFDFLLPLIAETAERVKRVPPLQVQTGPALRGDQETVNRHLALLENPEKQALYMALTRAIQNDYEKELQRTTVRD